MVTLKLQIPDVVVDEMRSSRPTNPAVVIEVVGPHTSGSAGTIVVSSANAPVASIALGPISALPPQLGGDPRMTSGAGNPGALQVAPFDLYQIDLTVSWGGRFGSAQHTARFSTLRTMNPDPNNAQGMTGITAGRGRQNSGAVGR